MNKKLYIRSLVRQKNLRIDFFNSKKSLFPSCVLFNKQHLVLLDTRFAHIHSPNHLVIILK